MELNGEADREKAFQRPAFYWGELLQILRGAWVLLCRHWKKILIAGLIVGTYVVLSWSRDRDF
ncbi:MAG: hypothetical protein HC904_11380 [Blastochloris sp.]|nr:hypothetical protein [Blastochloris sp.]